MTIKINNKRGGDALLDGAGIEATELYDDIGHSDEAHLTMKTYYIGNLKK